MILSVISILHKQVKLLKTAVFFPFFLNYKLYVTLETITLQQYHKSAIIPNITNRDICFANLVSYSPIF